MSSHLDALEALFESVEEEIGPLAGPKTCDALYEARKVIAEEHRKEDLKDPR